jgi:hypothetical protein
MAPKTGGFADRRNARKAARMARRGNRSESLRDKTQQPEANDADEIKRQETQRYLARFAIEEQDINVPTDGVVTVPDELFDLDIGLTTPHVVRTIPESLWGGEKNRYIHPDAEVNTPINSLSILPTLNLPKISAESLPQIKESLISNYALRLYSRLSDSRKNLSYITDDPEFKAKLLESLAESFSVVGDAVCIKGLCETIWGGEWRNDILCRQIRFLDNPFHEQFHEELNKGMPGLQREGTHNDIKYLAKTGSGQMPTLTDGWQKILKSVALATESTYHFQSPAEYDDIYGEYFVWLVSADHVHNLGYDVFSPNPDITRDPDKLALILGQIKNRCVEAIVDVNERIAQKPLHDSEAEIEKMIHHLAQAGLSHLIPKPAGEE